MTLVVPKKYLCPELEVYDGKRNREPVAGKCAAEVPGRWNGFQCQFKAGKGPQGLFCGRHAKIAERDGYEIIA